MALIQLTLLSRPRLSRITAYLEVKIWTLPKYENLITGNKILWKRGEIAPEEQFLLITTIFRNCSSSLPQYFQYTSNFKRPITYTFFKSGCSIYFPSILQILYVGVRVSRSILESPLEFEITRVDCTYFVLLFVPFVSFYVSNCMHVS